MSFDDQVAAAQQRRRQAETEKTQRDQADAARVEGFRRDATSQLGSVRAALAALARLSTTHVPDLDTHYDWYVSAPQLITPPRRGWGRAPKSFQEGWIIWRRAADLSI